MILKKHMSPLKYLKACDLLFTERTCFDLPQISGNSRAGQYIVIILIS